MHSNENNIIEFGSSCSTISPENKILMDGFADRIGNIEGIDLDIFVKAFVFKSSKTYFSIVSIECLGLPESFEEQVLNKIKKTININLEKLVITFTHTHSSPKIKDVTPTLFSRYLTKIEKKQINKYYSYLLNRVVKTILQASKNLKQCKVAYSIGKVNFATNRRMFNGPKSNDLPIVYIYNLQNKIMAILFNYTCHCVNQKNHFISGDWAGYAQIYTEKHFSDIICIATIGCAADQNPNQGVAYTNNKFAKIHGRKIAKEIFKKSLTLNNKFLKNNFKFYYKKIYLKYEKSPNFKNLCGISKFDSPEGFNAHFQLQKLKNNKKFKNIMKYDITLWKFFNIPIIFLPDEVCIDYFLLIKKIFKYGFVISYCRYLRGYIPSERLLKEGGYG